MSSGWVWLGYSAFALCLIGSAAWPLWSDNDIWMLAFIAVAALVVQPIMLAPALRALWKAFRPGPSPKIGSDSQ